MSKLPRWTAALCAPLVLAAAARAATPLPPIDPHEACELAVLYAGQVADSGKLATESLNNTAASNYATGARIPAIDAARNAKACGCPDAIPPLAEAALAAERASVTIDLVSTRQYGTTIRKNAEAALAALKRCANR
jgi:hypothetical protein